MSFKNGSESQLRKAKMFCFVLFPFRVILPFKRKRERSEVERALAWKREQSVPQIPSESRIVRLQDCRIVGLQDQGTMGLWDYGIMEFQEYRIVEL